MKNTYSLIIKTIIYFCSIYIWHTLFQILYSFSILSANKIAINTVNGNNIAYIIQKTYENTNVLTLCDWVGYFVITLIYLYRLFNHFDNKNINKQKL